MIKKERKKGWLGLDAWSFKISLEGRWERERSKLFTGL